MKLNSFKGNNFYDFFTKVFAYFKKRHLLCEASGFYLQKELVVEIWLFIQDLIKLILKVRDSKMSKRIIGVDIGATKIKLGLVEDSKVIKERKIPTLAQSSEQQIIKNIIEGIEDLAGQDFKGIGIGVPGLVDEEEGVIYDLLNIPSWKEVHLQEKLRAHFNKKVRITNDANVFAVGEKFFGEGKDYKNLVGITLGTGFGTGIIIDHQLYSGTLSSAGEIGSIPYLDSTIENYCSGKFFLEQYHLKGDEAFKRAQAGDEEALRIMEEFGQHLGNAVKLILNVLSPQAIFFGGSISKSYQFFEDALWTSVNEFPFKRVLERLVLRPSLTSNISILGAAALIASEAPVEKQVHP